MGQKLPPRQIGPTLLFQRLSAKRRATHKRLRFQQRGLKVWVDVFCRVFFQDKDYVGKYAVRTSPDAALVQLEVTPPGGEHGDTWLWGHEPVHTDGKHAGWISSAIFNFSESQLVVWALLQRRPMGDARIEIEVATQRIPARLWKGLNQ